MKKRFNTLVVISSISILSIVIMASKSNSSISLNTGQANTAKVGHINLIALLYSIPEYAQGEEEISAYLNYQEELLKTIEDDYEKKLTDYDQKKHTYSTDIRDRKEKELQNLSTVISTQRKKMKYEGHNKRGVLKDSIMRKVWVVIDEVGKENNFSYIIDSGKSTILYSDKSLDITPLVKSKLGL